VGAGEPVGLFKLLTQEMALQRAVIQALRARGQQPATGKGIQSAPAGGRIRGVGYQLQQKPTTPGVSIPIGGAQAISDQGGEISSPLAQGFNEGARLPIGALEELLQELIGPGRA
jgi:hypothetical protein